jgi:FkbM family methyltransferase
MFCRKEIIEIGCKGETMLKRVLKTLKFLLSHPFNQGRPLSALFRYVRWQIGSRLVPGSVAVPFVENTRLLVSPGMTGATGNVYTGLHDFEDMSFVRHLLRDDDFFIDIGANVGVYTILAAGAGARCIAVEPIPSTYDRLLDNVHLNRLNDRVTPMNIGLASKPGHLMFTSKLDTVNRVVSAGEPKYASTTTVPVETLDAVMDRMSERSPRCIKIDVEGFESDVLDGAAEVLRDEGLWAVVLEINESAEAYGFDSEEVFRRMISFGFRTMRYAPFQRRLAPMSHGWNLTGNTLFVRNPERVGKRLQSAPPFCVLNINV